MKLIAGQLYLETCDLVRAGVSSDAIAKASGRGSLEFIKDPKDKRASLFLFDSLPKRYATFVKEVFGEPMDYFNSQELKKLVIEDRTAFDFFSSYRFADGTGLPTEHILNYTKAASWLNMLSTTNHKTTGHKTAAEFYAAIITILKAEDVPEIPRSYERIKKAIKKYNNSKYEGLISTKFGNANREKLGRTQKAYIRSVYANTDKAQVLLPVQVAWLYNTKAKAEGWPQVSDRTVFNYINTSEVQILCAKERYGKKELLNIIPVINRKRASFPNAMWGIDGTPLELAYREGTKVGRLYVFSVFDHYSNKWIGVSISDTETGETVMKAIKNACVLGNCLPHQIQSDNGSAIIRCKEQLEQIATHFTPAKVGWARSKRVEAIQGHVNSTVLKWYENHTGANITAKSKDRGINPDEVKKKLPTKQELIRQIYEAQTIWNLRPSQKTGKSPNELYQHESAKPRFLGIEERIRLFGVPRKKPVTYTNEGITLKIEGEDVRFVVADVDFYVHNYGQKFLVKIDPEDTTMIGLFNPEDGRFVEWAFEKVLVPEAEIDHSKKTKLELYKQLRFQKDVEKAAETDSEERAKILDSETISKLEVGINGRYKDLQNEVAEHMKTLELVGVLEPVEIARSAQSKGLYTSNEGDTGRELE